MNDDVQHLKLLLQQRRRPTLCLVVAGLECMMFPFGSVLGVFTIIILLRPCVRQLFGRMTALMLPIHNHPIDNLD